MYGFKILCEISKGPFEISHKILNPYTMLENAKKNRQNFFLRLWKNPELILINMFRPTYLYAKFGDFSLKNEFRNVKRGRLIKWSIMHIFNEAEPPWSNLSDILG